MLDQKRFQLSGQLAVRTDYDRPPGQRDGGVMSLHGIVRDKSGSVSKELFDYSRSYHESPQGFGVLRFLKVEIG